MNGNACRVWGRRGARVVSSVGWLCFGYQKPAGPCLFLGHHANATTSWIVYDVSVPVPIYEAGWVWRFQNNARQVYVTSTPDIHFRVSNDLGLRYWKRKKKYEFFGFFFQAPELFMIFIYDPFVVHTRLSRGHHRQ